MTKPTGRPRGRPRKDGSPPRIRPARPPAPPPPPNKGGRPRREIDLELVRRSAAIGCTNEEIAVLVGMKRRGFHDRLVADPDLAAAIEDGRPEGRATLRRYQWQAAAKGNTSMLIWLGKQYLGQTDKSETTNLTPEELRRAADLARSEASRRGVDVDAADRPPAGTLPH